MKLTFPITLIFFLCVTNSSFSAYTNYKDDVQVLPFFALARIPKTLHLIDDQFRLIQHIDLKPVIEHIHSIGKGFVVVKNKYDALNDTAGSDVLDSELKVTTLIQQIADTIDTGVQLLPHNSACIKRKKRAAILEIDEEVVDTHPLFPSVGKLFQWVTGSLSADAGKYINQNFNNIKRLTRMSARFAQMFNSTLKIQLKHKQQILEIKSQVENMDSKFTENLNKLNRKVIYLEFLNNLNVVVMDLTRTVDMIFQHTDQIELNKMGPLSRDPVFLKAVKKLMDSGLKSKSNSLYLLKLASTIDIEACQWSITITYTFPVLKLHDFTPKRVISIPKEIKGKFFALSENPYMISWSDRVYIFTQNEFNNCKHFNKHMFCRLPSHTQGLLQNCIYGIINKIPWTDLSEICPITYVPYPQEFIEFSQTHLIYFNTEQKYASVLCPDLFGGAKTLTLNGAGIVAIPNGCKIKYGNIKSFAMGHVSRSADISLDIDNSIYNTNFSHILPLLKVDNVLNVSSLWEDTVADEQIIEQGVEETLDILNFIKFTPSGVTITLITLIAYTTLASFVIFIGIYMICVPGSAMRMKHCCCFCCKSKSKVVNVKTV